MRNKERIRAATQHLFTCHHEVDGSVLGGGLKGFKYDETRKPVLSVTPLIAFSLQVHAFRGVDTLLDEYA